MPSKFESALKSANSRLKAGLIRVRLETKGSKIVIRGTLPPKPISPKDQPYQQRISTGEDCNMLGLSRAEAMAKKIGGELAAGSFDWVDYGHGVRRDTCGYWIEKYRADYWLTRAKTPSTINSWRVYNAALKALDPDRILSIEYLKSVLEQIPPDSSPRRKYSTVYGRLAKLAGLPSKEITRLKGGYGTSSVEPRDLPSQDEILDAYELLKGGGWKWAFGMLATYGLRPHELFGLDLSEFPTIYTHPRTKRGRRFIYPVPQDWVKYFDLENVVYPPIKKLKQDPSKWDWQNLGCKINRNFRRRDIPFIPYALRHSYARHCFELGMRADFASKLMGHSLKIHMQVYRNFWGQDTYKNEYERLINVQRATD